MSAAGKDWRQHKILKWRPVMVMAIAALSGCGSPYELHCRDLVSPQEATFERVQALIVAPGPQSCSRCHNTRTPVRNLNFEGPGVAYDALTSRMPTVYEQIASGTMPKGGPAWTEANLILLRSWYCHGAAYAP